MSSTGGASRRARQADSTHRDIVAAGRRLFAAQGYAKTSVAQIAAEAGVSIQTIYDSVGSKSAIVSRLNDLIDTEGDVAQHASRIPNTTDPVELLSIAVTISRNIMERCADIVATVFSASAVEPEMLAIRQESRRRHRAGIRRLTRQLESIGALAPGADLDQVADVIAGMTDPQVAVTFVEDYGWSWDTWYEWTVASLATLVLR